MKIPRISLRSRLAAAAVVVTLAGGGAALAAASPAAAYGPTQVYSIAVSANISGANGGGVWLWFGLNSDLSGDYQGADCGHHNGHATPDSGNVTWQLINNGTEVQISGVILNGLGGLPVTVTVPAAYGHSSGPVDNYISLPSFIIPPGVGNTQVQVAP